MIVANWHFSDPAPIYCVRPPSLAYLLNRYSILKMHVINNQQNYPLFTQWQSMFRFLSLLPWLHIVCLLSSGIKNSNLAASEKLEMILEVIVFVHRFPVPIAECVDEFNIASATNPSYCGGMRLVPMLQLSCVLHICASSSVFTCS